MHPLLIDDKNQLDRDRKLCVASKTDITSSKAVQLQHTTLSWCLTKTYKRTGIFEDKEEIYKRMTYSRISFSVVTGLVCLREDSVDNIGTSRLNWKCVTMFTTEKEKKAVERRF